MRYFYFLVVWLHTDAIVCSVAEGQNAVNEIAPSWNANENPELAGKDIGTQMAHMVDIELPDF